MLLILTEIQINWIFNIDVDFDIARLCQYIADLYPCILILNLIKALIQVTDSSSEYECIFLSKSDNFS